MLVATGNENWIVIWIELDSKYRVVSSVPESQGSILLPDENLNTKCTVHANTNNFLSICWKDKVKHSALMSCVQNNQCLHSLCVPNMDQRVNVDLSSCHNPEERMFGQSRYLQLMPLIEVLHFFICVIHYSYSWRVVDKILVASSMDLVILYRLLLLE